MDYSQILSKNVIDIKPSGIRKFFDLLGDRKDVISLTVGEPDFIACSASTAWLSVSD